MDEKKTTEPVVNSSESEPKSKHSNKNKSKNLWTVIGVLSVVILVILAAAVLLPKKPVSKSPTASNINTTETAAIPTLPVTVPASWHSIKTQVYSVSVPTGWEPSVLPFKGGASLVLQPHNVAMEPMLVIEAFTSPNGTLEDKIDLYKKFNFQRTNMVIQKQPAVKLTGMRDRRTINKKLIKTPTQYRLVYMSRGKSIYSVRMYYSSPSPVQTYDDVFEKVATSFVSTK